jgi:hypothetical protein
VGGKLSVRPVCPPPPRYTSVVQGDVVLHRRTEELFARWCELAAFSPVYRSHEGMQPAANVQFDHDADTLDAFRRFAIVHRALAPYRRTLLEQVREPPHPCRGERGARGTSGCPGGTGRHWDAGLAMHLTPPLPRGMFGSAGELTRPGW